jgi:uncharacterized Rmd1/YagE family protein
MKGQLFGDATSIKAHALFVGQRLDLKDFEKAHRLASSPLVVTASNDRCAVLFRYGVVVYFGLSTMEEMSRLGDLKTFIREPFAKHIESEEVEIVVDRKKVEGPESSIIYVKEYTIERIQLIADALAKSVVLSYYETNIAGSFDRIEPLAESLRGGRGYHKARQLLRHMGDSLITHTKMVGRVEVSGKPELLWEHPEHEILYHKLMVEYELRERHIALEQKLDLILRTAETLLGVLQANRTLRVEWYIVILILFEILLTLYNMFFP